MLQANIQAQLVSARSAQMQAMKTKAKPSLSALEARFLSLCDLYFLFQVSSNIKARLGQW